VQDISKQGLSALLAHCLNLFLAVLLQQLSKRGDGCIWYFVNLMMDTSIGLTMCYGVHKVIEKIAVKNQIEVRLLAHSGWVGAQEWSLLQRE
jgi:hypothetical protein